MLGIDHAVLILLRMDRGGALDLRLDHARFSAWIYECGAHGRVGNRAGGSRVPLDQDSTGAMQRPQTHLPHCQTEATTKRSGLIESETASAHPLEHLYGALRPTPPSRPRSSLPRELVHQLCQPMRELSVLSLSESGLH